MKPDEHPASVGPGMFNTDIRQLFSLARNSGWIDQQLGIVAVDGATLAHGFSVWSAATCAGTSNSRRVCLKAFLLSTAAALLPEKSRPPGDRGYRLSGHKAAEL